MKYIFGAICLLLSIIACSNKDDSWVVGEELINSGTSLLFIDTLTIRAGTFKFDSLIVSNSSPVRLLVGSYEDPIFGRSQSESFVQLLPTDFDIPEEAVFDSIALLLNYDGYYYNDTIPLQTISVKRVLENIKPEDDNYYNTTTFETEEETLGVSTFYPRPLGKDTLHIKMQQDFGQNLFTSIQTNEINSTDEFLVTYKGLAIAAGESNTAILGFGKESRVRLYYQIEDEDGTIQDYYDIPVSEINSFNHIYSYRIGTILAPLNDNEILLPSSGANNQTFVQSGVGIVTHIDIPYLKKLYEIEGKGTIISANLKIALTPLSQQIAARDSLNIIIVDNNSNYVEDLTAINGDKIYGIYDQENSEFGIAYYNIPIKTFLNSKLDINANNDNLYLAIYSNQFNSSMDRYVFYGDGDANAQRIKLEITYALYDDE